MNQYVFSHTAGRTGSHGESDVETYTVQRRQATAMEDLIHELRQPLSAIESLAYYLELTSKDEKAIGHLRRIQTMVLESNRILLKAQEEEPVHP
jgi:signal transduction histidine kinase